MSKKDKTSEQGSLILEATFVFPIMFVVIFFLLIMGNIYYQKCRVQRYTVTMAADAAANCADPLLSSVTDGGVNSIGFNEVDLKPYRYIPLVASGYMDEIAEDAKEGLETDVNNLHDGFFLGMHPTSVSATPDPDMKFVYSKLKLNVDYQIKMPIRLLFTDHDFVVDMSSTIDVPVSDVPEFIRNVDYVDDLVQKYTGAEGGIATPMNKIKEKIKQFGEKKK